jgi:hypothetical protein
MATVKRIAPIFPVRDLDASLAHYRQLGFTVRRYEGGGYGFATRDRVEIHLGRSPTTITAVVLRISLSTMQTH